MDNLNRSLDTTKIQSLIVVIRVASYKINFKV